MKILLLHHSYLLAWRKTEPFTVLVLLPRDWLLPHKTGKDRLVFVVPSGQLRRRLVNWLGTEELAFKHRKKE